MRYRKLTASGDYTFGGGQLDFYRDTPEAVGQAVKTRLLLWVGEWYLNLDSGTPFMQSILGKKSKESADAALQDRILTTEGVLSLDSYESAIDSVKRKLTVTATVNTTFGPTTIEVSNYANF